MNPRFASRLAWSLWALALGFVPISLLFGVLALGASLPKGREPFLISIVVLDVLLVLYGTLGALIASRRQENPIGWIFCAVALSLGLVAGAYGYADYVLYAGGDFLPGAVFAAWLTNWLPILAVYVPACFLFLLFPDGHPPSPRWRPAVWALAVVGATAALSSAFEPGRIYSFPTLENPLGLGASFGRIVSIAGDVTDFLAIPTFLISLAAMVTRLRHARGRERLQLKWVAYAAILTATSFAASFLFGLLAGFPRAASDIFFLLGVVGFTSVPVTAGIAILRHRLYDIDRIINRTLVYGALTASLALVYVGSVVVLQRTFVAVTGQSSQLVIVASTLVIAALFGPLRRRIQAVVDRRFYRRKYDATRTLAAFSSRLRDATDLEALSDDLLSVVGETVQPAHVSLWLRPFREAGSSGKSEPAG